MRHGHAADLVVGFGQEIDTIDPHFHAFGANVPVQQQIFEPLVVMDGHGVLAPGLADSWKPVGESAWEFHLRPGVTFHDGTKLLADDVVFTLQRAANVPNSPAGFGSYLRPIATAEATDSQTVLIHTKGPAPLLPAMLSVIDIISRHVGATATTEDYNTGKAAIGTGPYRFVSWARGAEVDLVRNDAYWGAKPEWQNVRVRVIPNAASRLGALLAGDVGLIDTVAASDVPRLQASPGYKVESSVSTAMVGFLPDMTERVPPFITDNAGQPLARNPLADVRVRRAINRAIDRQAIKDRIMSGEVAVAGQIMQPGQYGYTDTVPLPAFDPQQARAELAAAGYPDGFRMTMHCQDRFYNVSSLCQAVSQMLTRIGIKTEPVVLPHIVYVGHANRHEYSFGTTYGLIELGEPSLPLSTMLATFDGAQGLGSGNRGRYSNPAFDALLDKAQSEIDPAARETILKQATEIAFRDVAIIPVFRLYNIEAMRADLAHTPPASGYVFAADIHTKAEISASGGKPAH